MPKTSTRKWLLSSPPVMWAASTMQEMSINALREGPIPQHVAFVMDGNRRFARQSHLETVEGHNLGFEALAKILEVCYKSGVKVVTVYAFSIENFKRSQYEVDALMDIAKIKLQQLSQHGDLLDRYGASIRILGQRSLVSKDVLAAIDKATEMTKHNTKAILNVCFPYTSRDEMATSIRSIVSLAAPENEASSSAPAHPSDSEYESTSTLVSSSENHKGPLDVESITEKTIEDHLFTSGNPPLDLLVRTSGVERLSDFMLWQCHKDTHIEFVDCLWPEFDVWKFLPILVTWGIRQRKVEKAQREAKREQLRRSMQDLDGRQSPSISSKKAL